MKKPKLPKKPELGSIEMNRIIRAVNYDDPNPFPDNQKCTELYEKYKKGKEEKGIYYGLVESDEYEDALLRSMIP